MWVLYYFGLAQVFGAVAFALAFERIFESRESMSVKLSWLLVVFCLPLIGAALCYLWGPRPAIGKSAVPDTGGARD